MGIKVGGLLGLLVLIADVFAIVHVFGSRRSVGAKVAWTVLVLIFPLLDFLIWLLFGPRAARAIWQRAPAGGRPQGAGSRNSVAT